MSSCAAGTSVLRRELPCSAAAWRVGTEGGSEVMSREVKTMGKLTSKGRDSLPAKDFAGPSRSYPVEDKTHAANAKARASQAVKAGRMSKGEEAKIDAKANEELAKDKKK